MLKVSIITIAYNSANCIEETIASVLDQSYSNIEYLIIDGASQDDTVQKAESFMQRMEEKGISYRIISEPDSGIYNAMNKGIKLATGDIIGILNSGDWYEPETVETAVNCFTSDTDEKESCELMFGNIRMYKTDGEQFIKKARQRRYQSSRDWNHPTMFVKSELYKAYPFRELGIHDDYGFYLQMRKQNRRIATVDKILANFKMGGASNHKSLKAARKRISDRYKFCYRINGYSRWYIIECVGIELVKMILG